MSAQSQIFNPTLRTSQASGDGFSCPVMNTASRLTLNFGVSDKGMMVYDTTLSNVMYWTGTVWLPLGGGLVPVGASLNTQVIYNNAGVLEGDAGLTFNNVTDALTVSGIRISKGNISTDITNTAIGNGASNSIIASIYTTAVGREANATCTGGNSGTAIGYRALSLNNVGNGNTAVGVESLYNAVGDSNTAIGYLAGQLKTTGSNCGFFGSNAQASAVGVSDENTYGDTSVTNHRFANGNVSLINGNVVMASAKGIDFSATAGAGTSELLADYEEGTWSPTPSGEVNLTSVVSVNALYTKVGRLVTVSGLVTATVTLPNILTSFRLPSLPFANVATTVGTVFIDGVLKAGGAQVFGSSVAGYFPAASALSAGAAVFYYSVTYSV
jgi:hypothetical protein